MDFSIEQLQMIHDALPDEDKGEVGRLRRRIRSEIFKRQELAYPDELALTRRIVQALLHHVADEYPRKGPELDEIMGLFMDGLTNLYKGGVTNQFWMALEPEERVLILKERLAADPAQLTVLNEDEDEPITYEDLVEEAQNDETLCDDLLMWYAAWKLLTPMGNEVLPFWSEERTRAGCPFGMFWAKTKETE